MSAPRAVPAPLETSLPAWVAARRYGVPAAMVAGATARRAAGDWAGACAAARVDVRVDLAGIADRYGVELAGVVEEDLRHLVPDLVRWHLPREVAGGHGLIAPGLAIALAWYGGDPDAPALWVRTPAHLERPQRPQLRFGPLPRDRRAVQAERWDAARYLWDARATGGLLHRLGGGDRTPFHHRDGRRLTAAELPTSTPTGDDPVALVEWTTALQDAQRWAEAWAAAGVPADLSGQPGGRWGWRALEAERNATVPTLVAAVRDRLAAEPPTTWTEQGTAAFVLQDGHHWRTGIVVTVGPAGMTAEPASGSRLQEATVLPRVSWQRFPELELLRLGRLQPSGLHPLVRAALFPDRAADDGYRPLPDPVVPGSVPVRCRGGWHRVGWRDGRVDAYDHGPEEAQRERAMRALGGSVPPCFTVIETWRAGTSGRLPRRLRQLRRHALALITNGDAAGFLDLLDRGVDPAGVRTRRGQNPLHLAAHLDDPGVDPVAFVGRLVAAGLDVDGTDATGRTPLSTVLFDGGSAPLVRALLDAGADATRTDDLGCSALHLVRSADAAVIVPWLVGAGLGLEARDGYGRTPLMGLVISQAPPEALRALLDAGADPRATDEYTDECVVDRIDPDGYDDLEFLREAAEPDVATPNG